MPTIRKRNNSYQITVSCGYDINNRQIRRTMTYTPEKGMTAKQIEKEVQRQAPTDYNSFVATYKRNITDCRRCTAYNSCKAIRARRHRNNKQDICTRN